MENSMTRRIFQQERKTKTVLTFNFNEEKVAAAGITTDELLEEMRTLAKEYGVTETSYGVFEKEGEHAVAILVGYAVEKAMQDWEFYEFLDSLIADVDGAIEDCKEEMRRILQGEQNPRAILQEERKTRTILTFNFNKEKVKAAGITTDELLADMRAYARECGVTETSYGVFQKEGIDAMAILIGYAVRKSDSDPEFINYLTSWIADVNGNKEDCKAAIERKYNKQQRG